MNEWYIDIIRMIGIGIPMVGVFRLYRLYGALQVEQVFLQGRLEVFIERLNHEENLVAVLEKICQKMDPSVLRSSPGGLVASEERPVTQSQPESEAPDADILYNYICKKDSVRRLQLLTSKVISGNCDKYDELLDQLIKEGKVILTKSRLMNAWTYSTPHEVPEPEQYTPIQYKKRGPKPKEQPESLFPILHIDEPPEIVIPTSEDEYLTREAAALFVGVSDVKIFSWRKNNILKAYLVPEKNGYFYKKSELELLKQKKDTL